MNGWIKPDKLVANTVSKERAWVWVRYVGVDRIRNKLEVLMGALE